jgi:hypothetical protein
MESNREERGGQQAKVRAVYSLDEWFIATDTGKTLALLLVGIALIFLGALGFMATSPEHESMGFGSLIWESYIHFVDPGTQTSLDLTMEPAPLMAHVFVSISGFMYLLVTLGITVDSIRSYITTYQLLRARIVANDHTVFLGWSPETIYVVEALAATWSENWYNNRSARRHIVVLAEVSEEVAADIQGEIQDTFKDVRAAAGHALKRKRRCRALQRWCCWHWEEQDPIVTVWKGDPTKSLDLERVSVSTAAHLMVVCSSGIDNSSQQQQQQQQGATDNSDISVMSALLSLIDVHNDNMQVLCTHNDNMQVLCTHNDNMQVTMTTCRYCTY